MTHAFLRTLFMYLLLVGSIRLLGKRQVGQMEPSEFVVTMLAANLATVSIEEPEASPLFGVVAILTILGAELAISWLTLSSIPMRRLLCGKPVILIENGRLLQDNLRRTRLNVDELTGKLREKNVLDLTCVRYAILETNGSLSVFLYPGENPVTARDLGISGEDNLLPVTLVEDGVVLEENLRKAGKDRSWLRGVLQDRGTGEAETLLLTVDAGNHIFFLKKEERP